MITVVATFPSPEGATLESVTEIFESTAPLYRDLPGLVLKSYIFDPESRTAGGVYLLENEAAADRLFDATWHARVTEKYGAEPTVRRFHSPVVVDNSSGRIGEAAA